MASRKQEIRKEIKKKNAKLGIDVEHHKKRKRVLFQELKVFLMMKENNLKN